MANQNICIGIDLGTTNSVIAWGRVGSKDDPIEPEIIDVRRYNIERSLVETPLLPSCVYFPEGKDYFIVGEYGKGFTDPNDVKRTEKSFKIEMGDKNRSGREIDGHRYSATELSTIVLKHLKESAEKTLFSNIPFPDNVAIAIPASFEKDMFDATLEAAKHAGFKKPILVDEPIAVLNEFNNCINRGAFPPERFDFSGEGKLILIFDLGGGTLDVALYKICYGMDERDLDIKKIAVSRFTAIGGDNFDKELTNRLLGKYLEYDPSKEEVLTPNAEALEHRFRLYAENAKIELSTQLEIWKIYGQSDELDADSITAKIDGRPSERKPFTFELSLKQYEEWVEDLLASDLTLDFIDRYNPSEDPQNIIEPIFDVLKKSENSLGCIPKPDIVLLNGSMARLYTIQKRLKDFFGFPPVDIGYSELAVARGAVVWLSNEINKMKSSNS